MSDIELEPTVFIEGMSRDRAKSNEVYDQVKGAECNLKTKGRPIIALTVSNSQYNLIMSALVGKIKEEGQGVAKLLALELNSQLMKHQMGLADTLSRVNDSIEEALDSELAHEWKRMQDRKVSRK